MRDGLKRFNAEPQISSLSTEQFADSLCRFIRSENVGDLWFVLMQSAKKQAKEKEALLSKTEKLFFEFVYEVNENNEQRWSEIFMTLARWALWRRRKFNLIFQIGLHGLWKVSSLVTRPEMSRCQGYAVFVVL